VSARVSAGAGEARSPRKAIALAARGERSPLEQLLHALNQPLTGLQCSMEVALASPRTPEQYVQGLREGLELTGRMRALVEAIREVADVDGETDDGAEAIELAALLREVADELKAVAEVKSVRITLDGSTASSVRVKAGRRRLSSLVFRMLESVLSAGDQGSAMQIETSGAADVAADVNTDRAWVRIRWHAEKRLGEFSRPELGLLVAQAGWEGVGAKWERKRTETRETVTIWLPGVPASSRNS
jgi:signal transduction histidine kinase